MTTTTFTDAEIGYLNGQPLGRLDTVIPFDPAWIRIRPRRALTWGIDTGPFELAARDVAAR